MTKHVIPLGGITAAAVILATSASAEIKVNDNLAFSGYIVGSATMADLDTSTTSSTLDVDAMKLTTVAKFAPVTGTLSLYSSSDDKPVFLDAFATYDAGNGLTITGGKFLSWLGYEAFDPVNMTQITYGWNTLPGGMSVIGIPAYHSGVKIESTGDGYTAGFAVLDSNNYLTPYYKGDGHLDHGAGFEAYTTFKSGNFTTFIGAAYDKDDWVDLATYSGDIWVQYSAGSNTFAAELCYANQDPKTGDNTASYFWLLFAKHVFSDKFALSGRVAGGNADGTPADAEYLKGTIAPAWTITPNLEIVGEVSYTTFDGLGYDDGLFAGLQARFKF
ncbi:MAG: outer membrane beta-barrel protein [Chlorobia bacterium]|nr:outer membrane beta-barrel protein [Fimbriimonadaceae bacterium]